MVETIKNQHSKTVERRYLNGVSYVELVCGVPILRSLSKGGVFIGLKTSQKLKI